MTTVDAPRSRTAARLRGKRRLLAAVTAAWGLACGGAPSAAAHDFTPWMGRPATQRKHFQGDQFARAGNPQCISPLAMPAESPHEVSYYAGGGARTKARGGEERREVEGIWGVDYGGILFPKHVDLGWWHGARYQGGYGAYRTDGPRLLHKP